VLIEALGVPLAGSRRQRQQQEAALVQLMPICAQQLMTASM
jgi:hypothetical protein